MVHICTYICLYCIQLTQQQHNDTICNNKKKCLYRKLCYIGAGWMDIPTSAVDKTSKQQTFETCTIVQL